MEKATPEDLASLKPFLDRWVERIEIPEFIEGDPVLFMHAFEAKEDQAIAGFFAALMAWGRRDVVIDKVSNLLERMNNRPAAFIKNFSENDRPVFRGFKHRTFKPVDMYWLCLILSTILRDFGSFESFWSRCYRISQQEDRELVSVFHEEFFALHPEAARRTRKHISDSAKNSTCKRIYLYLKWCIRKGSPVDPGIMNFMSPAELMIPLDVHVGRQARKLGLLTRTYNDWKAVTELSRNLRKLDSADPAKYDYALFGIGVSESPIPPEYLKNRLD